MGKKTRTSEIAARACKYEFCLRATEVAAKGVFGRARIEMAQVRIDASCTVPPCARKRKLKFVSTSNVIASESRHTTPNQTTVSKLFFLVFALLRSITAS